MKKQIIAVVATIMLCNYNIFGYAYGVEKNEEFVKVKEVFGEVELISENDMPDDVVPIKFDTAEEALNYLEIVNEQAKEGKELVLLDTEVIQYYDEKADVIDLSGIEIKEDMFKDAEQQKDIKIGGVIECAENTKSKSKDTWKGPIHEHIDVVYTYYNDKRFKDVVDVTSYYTGLTFGNNWVQKSYTYEITENGTKLKVNIKGVMEHYILINTALTRLASDARTLTAEWKYK